MKITRDFLSENFQFWKVKFSIYLNKHACFRNDIARICNMKSMSISCLISTEIMLISHKGIYFLCILKTHTKKK